MKRITNTKTSFWRLANLKMWLLLIIGVVAFFPVFRYIRKQLAKNQEQKGELNKDKTFNENQDPEIAQIKADDITVDKGVQASSKSLAHHLGTKYSDQNKWYDIFNPSGWSEDDTKVADILTYQRKNYKLLEKLYNKVYTNSRVLIDDLNKLLDDDQKKRVRKYLKIF